MASKLSQIAVLWVGLGFTGCGKLDLEVGGDFIAKPELPYPETNAFQSTRPSGSGDLARTHQDTVTLVSL
jgi:hypothetical protein